MQLWLIIAFGDRLHPQSEHNTLRNENINEIIFLEVFDKTGDISGNLDNFLDDKKYSF